MPGKSRYTPKEDREAAHIKESVVKKGGSEKKANAEAYGHIENQRKGKK